MDLNTTLFFKALTGNKEQPTFSQKQLETLRDIIKAKQDANYKREMSYFPRSQESYSSFPNYQSINGKLLPVPYDQYKDQLEKKLATFDKTRDKTSVTYEDYGKDFGGVDNTGWIDSLKRSEDPRYQLATSLGQFNAYDKGDHYLVEDQYDWNKSNPMELSDLWKAFSSPQSMGNTAGRILQLQGPKISIKVPK